MNHKIKSLLYFASLVLALITYYTMDNTDSIQNNEMVNNTIVQVSNSEALN
jgi:hypothetical protein